MGLDREGRGWCTGAMRALRTTTLAAALCAAVSLVATPVAAEAAPGVDKTWVDGPESSAPALDITRVRRVAAAEPGRSMRIVVRFAEPIEAGDSLEVHLSTDRDLAPEVWFAGSASSEFEVYAVDHWRDTDNPIGSACGRMRFALDERRAVVRFDPQCLDEGVRAVRVNVQTYTWMRPRGREFAPARHAWLSRVAAYLDDDAPV